MDAARNCDREKRKSTSHFNPKRRNIDAYIPDLKMEHENVTRVDPFMAAPLSNSENQCKRCSKNNNCTCYEEKHKNRTKDSPQNPEQLA